MWFHCQKSSVIVTANKYPVVLTSPGFGNQMRKSDEKKQLFFI